MGRGFEKSKSQLEDIVKNKVAQLTNKNTTTLDLDKPFSQYGIDSLKAVEITNYLEKFLGISVLRTLLWDYPTINLLVEYLSNNTNMGIKNEKSNNKENISHVKEPIAIVGMGCRFPGAEGLQEYWDLLTEGKDAIQEVPRERWDIKTYYDKDPAKPGKINSKSGGFIKDIDQFDLNFFNISPREIIKMDPQQRVLLEISYEAMEDAGLLPDNLKNNSVGVFIGISTNDYSNLLLKESEDGDPYFGTGNSLSIAANRISYTFDFRGPSVAIDTACSSSLVSVYQACNSIWSNESSIALAGGVNLIIDPSVTVNLTKTGVLSPDGKCKTFDEEANGYVRGEGAGIVILKPYSQALKDGDQIYSVIRGGSVNNNGFSNGIFAPNGESQKELLERAYESANISPSQVQYVETHGTATKLGDPIEVNALGEIISINRSEREKCSIGSVKSNIGHLEAAAGIASLIKVALMIKHKKLVPSLHANTLNSYISFDKYPIYVQQKVEDWISDGEPLLAGVSSFGFGGTNSHLILEEVPYGASKNIPSSYKYHQDYYILPISAMSKGSIKSLLQSYEKYLSRQIEDYELYNICYTASTKRSHLKERLAILTSGKEDLISQINSLLSEWFDKKEKSNKRNNNVLFVLPNVKNWSMSTMIGLLKDIPAFRESWEIVDAEVSKQLGWSLWEFINTSAEELKDKKYYIGFALQLSLANMFKAWGVVPDHLLGVGTGELVVKYLKGKMDLTGAVAAIQTLEAEVSNENYFIKLLDSINNGYNQIIEISLDHSTIDKKLNEQHNQKVNYYRIVSDSLSAEYMLLKIVKELYDEGFNLNWENIYTSGEMIKLPTYIWDKSRYWFNTSFKDFKKTTNIKNEILELPENKTVQYYKKLADIKSPIGESLSFAPFSERIPGFSWLMTLSSPESNPENFEATIAAQEKMREVLFHNVDFKQISNIAEIGCGYSSDLIRLANLYNHVNYDGFNISSEQINLGYERIKKQGLSHIIDLYQADVVNENMPKSYDMIFSIQLLHHIQEKDKVFSNISSHLKNGGLLVLAEIYSNLNEQIHHPESSAYFLTKDDWAELLANHKLQVVECIDTSKEIGNFLYDPDFNKNIDKHFGNEEKNVIDHLSGPHLLGELLRKQAACYGLITVQKVNFMSNEKLRKINKDKFEKPTSFAYFDKNTIEDKFEKRELLEEVENKAINIKNSLDLEKYLIECVSSVLEFQDEKVDPNTELDSLGIDSISAIDLKKEIETDLGVQLSIGELLKGPTIVELSTSLINEFQVNKSKSNELSKSELEELIKNANNIDDIMKNLDHLNDEEIDRLLSIYQGKEE